MIDRDEEVEKLDVLLADVKAGFGRTLLIRGQAGIGKTHLLGELRNRARVAELTTLGARGGELERDYPFGCVRQMFEPVMRTPSQERDAALAGDARLAERVFQHPGEADQMPVGDPGHGTLHGLYWLTANLAERSTMLLTLDDAHWADPASLRYMSYLGRRLERVPTLLAATTRLSEPSNDGGLLSQIAQDPLTELIDLEPLSLSAVSSLMRFELDRDISSEMAVLCHEATQGNPFLIKEILAEISRKNGSDSLEQVLARGPVRIAEAVNARLLRVGSHGRELARAIAVLGDHAEMRIASALSGIEPDQGASIADALAAEAILDNTHPLRFIHPIVQTAVYERLGPAERGRWHGRAATLLAEAGKSDEVVALHLLATEPAGEQAVVELLRRAAESASLRGSPESAVTFLERALKEPPDGRLKAEVLTQLGRSAAPLGDERALDWLRDGMELGKNSGIGMEAARALGMALIFQGADDEVIEVCDRIRVAADAGGADGAQLNQWLISLALVSPATRGPAFGLSRANLADALDRDDLNPSLIASASLECAMTGGSAQDAGDLAMRSVEGGLLDVSGPESIEPAVVSIALAVCERYGAVDDLMREGREITSSEGDPRGLAGTMAFRALGRIREGKVREVLADAELYPGSSEPSVADLIMASCYLTALTEAGRLEEADAVAGVIESVGVNPMLTVYQLFAEALASLRLAQGSPRAALEVTSRIAHWEKRMELVNGVSFPWRSQAAIAHFMLGETDTARELAVEQVDMARTFGAPGALGVALRALGVVREGNDALELLEEAAEVLSQSQRPLEHARAMTDLGAAMRRSGQTTASRDEFRNAITIARESGASALADRATDELVASGAKPRTMASNPVESLTPSERRVADMAASGMRNKEIAQTLFVTVKTVETHLRHAYSKLDITSRTQLASRLNSE